MHVIWHEVNGAAVICESTLSTAYISCRLDIYLSSRSQKYDNVYYTNICQL